MADKGAYLEVLDAAPQKHINDLHRFALLVIGSYACICVSFSYAFNLISSKMQSDYHLSQRDLTTISTVGLVFQYVVLPYAFLYDHFGPLVISILATIFYTIGTLTLALSFRGIIKGTVVRLSVFNAIMLCGCALFDLTSCVTVPSFFPTRKGAIIALLKSYTGLGQSIVSTIYTAFFIGKEDNYLFLLMTFALIVGLLCIAFMRLPPYHLTNYEESHLSVYTKHARHATKAQYLRQNAPLSCFVFGFVIIIFLIVYLPTESTLVTYLNLSSKYKIAFAVIAIFVTFAYIGIAFPVAFVAEMKSKHNESIPSTSPYEDPEEKHVLRYSNEIDQNGNAENNTTVADVGVTKNKILVAIADDEPINEDNNANDNGNKEPETVTDYIAPQYQGTFFQNLLTPELWCIWWSMLCLVGAEFVIIYNASFVYAALNGSEPDGSMRALLTVFNGVGSAVGRLVMSYFEHWSASRPPEKRIPITVVLFIPACTVTVTIILFLTVPPRVLPLPFVLGALGNGFLAATTVLSMRCIYAKDPAKHYDYLFTASTVSLIAFNRFLYGEWYTKQAEKQHNANQRCYGKQCVLMPFCFLLGLCATSVITSGFAHIRYSRFCNLVLREREQLREEARQALLKREEENVNNDNNDNGEFQHDNVNVEREQNEKHNTV